MCVTGLIHTDSYVCHDTRHHQHFQLKTHVNGVFGCVCVCVCVCVCDVCDMALVHV